MTADATTASSSPRPAPLIGWRLLALFYDLWPMVALWMLASLVFTLGYQWAGHDVHDNIPPWSPLQLGLWLVCWLITAGYALASWRRGGQTLGMRPWRLRVVAADGTRPTWKALLLRYLVGNLSLLLGGLGFWWAWIDRDRLTWHDRLSGTRTLREPKRPRG
ncbi:RDD family protein [Montanilutibacter psychrotolerans]|uniref:RDD family protein n=1 Tax=Montanilutibacter psychrotolerans TaxID=1327343 RepID=A0A3M8SY01_9GAMM|nr:RDD family protein [Lysobacter psychrotolerans]RNF84326.1 RDD family protein [Lysobacter psychrotolerans]